MKLDMEENKTYTPSLFGTCMGIVLDDYEKKIGKELSCQEILQKNDSEKESKK